MADEPPHEQQQALAQEIDELQRGYAHNRRRSRIGLALGVLALVAILVSAPVGLVLLTRQNELGSLQRTADCRAQLAAAHDNATDDLWSRAISVPQDIEGARKAVSEADRINMLRLQPDPCHAVKELGPVTPAAPPVVATTTSH